jgi:hypothetical protein
LLQFSSSLVLSQSGRSPSLQLMIFIWRKRSYRTEPWGRKRRQLVRMEPRLLKRPL